MSTWFFCFKNLIYFIIIFFSSDIYEKESILISEEASIIAGLLVGLNAFDVTIDIKSELNEFDLPLKPLNYSLYLREKISEINDLNENENDLKINEILDQKNFLEEINKRLELNLNQVNKIQVYHQSNLKLN